jgi:hypothetical protein
LNSAVASGLLQLISAAVTPVVLISACAALILGINSKHTAIADRLRQFAGELRAGTANEQRAEQLRSQVDIFFHRYHLTWIALALLYSSVIAFIVMIGLIVTAQMHLLQFEGGILAAFVAGILLTLGAAVCEILEIRLAIRSLQVELNDVR